MALEYDGVFNLNTYPKDINPAVAKEFGRWLIATGHEIVAQYATDPKTPLDVRTMLAEMDATTRYERITHTPDGELPTIIGPSFGITSEGEERYRVGVAIWRQKSQAETPPSPTI